MKTIITLRKILAKILDKATMSPMLREAVEATLKAINKKNYELAYQLSVCKSFIVGNIDPEDQVHAFQEDEKANEKALGSSVYTLMDSVHFELAMKTENIPSGTVVVSHSGIQEMKKLQEDHEYPVIRRLAAESQAIHTGIPTKVKTDSKRKVIIK